MKKQAFIIKLPQPCHEKWEDMTLAEQGRFCAHCQKEVIDFTLMPDAEVIRIFKDATDGPPCGRFLESQLERPMIQPARPMPFHQYLAKKVAASLLVVQTLVTTAWAQAKTHKTEQQPTTRDSTERRPVTIQGRVVDRETGMPMPGMLVRVMGETIFDFTDSTGCFKVPYPANIVQSDRAIRVSNSKTFDQNGEAEGAQILDTLITFEMLLSGDDIIVPWYPQSTIYRLCIANPNLPVFTQGGPLFSPIDFQSSIELCTKPVNGHTKKKHPLNKPAHVIKKPISK